MRHDIVALIRYDAAGYTRCCYYDAGWLPLVDG